MGDFKKKNSLEEKIQERENRAAEGKSKTDTVKKITGTKEKKEKILSVRLYADTWAQFSEINRKRGMTSGSVVNMLITDYINEHMDLLE